LKVRDFLLQLQQTLDPQQANHLFNSVNVTGSKLNKAVQGWTQAQRKELITFLGQKAGRIPMSNVNSQAYAVQQKLFNQTFVNGAIEGTVMDILTETNQVTNTWKKADLNKAKQAYRNWLTQEVAASGLDNPQDIMNHINNIMGDNDHKSYQRLKKMLAIQTVDPTTKDPLLKPIFTYLETHGVGNAPQVTGVEQYRHLTGLAYGKPLDLSEVYQTPEINSGMKPLLMRLKQAKKNGLNLQHILANHMTPYIAERLKKGGLSVGMIVNEAIEHGDYKVDFQPLDANVFQDAQEIQAVEQRIPNFSRMSPQLQGRLLNGGFTSSVVPTSTIQKPNPPNVTSKANDRITRNMFGNRGFRYKGSNLGSAGTQFGHTGRDISATGPIALGYDWEVLDIENSYTPGKGYGKFVVGYIPSLDRCFKSNHHDANYVNIGDKVSSGQVFAKIGSTGLSTGSHIHFDLTKVGCFYRGQKGGGHHRDTLDAFGGVPGKSGPMADPDSFILNGGLLINRGGN